MLTIEFDSIQSMGFAVLTLLFGKWIINTFPKLEEYSLPPAIVGGLIFAIVNTILRLANLMVIKIDTEYAMLFMVIYFTTIGFEASLQALVRAKGIVSKFLFVSILAIFVQNFLALGLGKAFGIPGPLALLLGSPALVGGPGTAAAVSPSIEALGFDTATSVGVIAATLGIVLGSVSGGPVASTAIKKHNLSAKDPDASANTGDRYKSHSQRQKMTGERIAVMLYGTLVVIFLGIFVTKLLNFFVGYLVGGISFPLYIGPMIVAATVRNISDARDKPILDDEALGFTSDISLNIFLSLTMVGLELWTILDMAIPMLIIIALEAIITIAFARYVVYKLMGNNYDAAVMTAGFIGFGMGSSSNAMACMQQLTKEYGPSPLAFLAVSIVGALFIDFVNIFMIYGFINFL
ncbi:sodium/glutamate symporter [Aerococcus sanguinicola]|uniref:sodium/glutamate symporter n=1 Tax=Aerococcus sanguinicola TaxID=119206 RepID=UPI0018A70590|nr:sodium/glutamate symporter [Aerococcus sanguinicola]